MTLILHSLLVLGKNSYEDFLGEFTFAKEKGLAMSNNNPLAIAALPDNPVRKPFIL